MRLMCLQPFGNFLYPPFFSTEFVFWWKKTHLPLGGGCSMCSGSQMMQLLSAEGAANKARHYTKKQNKSESEGWLRFGEKMHHTTARAPSQRECPLPMHHIAAKCKRTPLTSYKPEHYQSANPRCPCITLQAKQQHNPSLAQYHQCWEKFMAF